MDQTYAFRRCESSDISDISILVNQAFGIHKNSDYWEWKYFKNPTGDTLSIITLFKGRVVGMHGFIPVRFSVGGREILGVQEVDVVIFEDHRRLDLYLKMVSLSRETLLDNNVHFAYGFTNEYSSGMNQTLIGKKKIGSVPRLVKLLDIEPFLRQRFSMSRLSKALSSIANPVLRIKYPEKPVIPEGMQVKQIDRFDKRFDRFWRRIEEDYPIMTVRDSRYLNWRYANTAYVKYEVVCLEKMGSKEIFGFIVFGERQHDYLIGRIYDIVTPRAEDPTIASCLLRFAINRFRQKKAAIVRCWMFAHSHVFPELIRIGFIPREKEHIDLDFQRINSGNSAVPADLMERRENWYLSMGDSDID